MTQQVTLAGAFRSEKHYFGHHNSAYDVAYAQCMIMLNITYKIVFARHFLGLLMECTL
jgi:hypothetical protein